MKLEKFVSTVLTAALLGSTAVLAASPAPDAGQVARELAKPVESVVPKVVSPIRIEGQAPTQSNPGSTLKFPVASIRVVGSEVFSASLLETLVSDVIGQQLNLAELEAAASRITTYYRKHGFLLARAYLPAQDIRDGAVVIDVLEGKLDRQRLKNQSLLPDAQAQRYLDGIKPGEALQAQQVDRVLLLLGDAAGVGGARAVLQPGASVGTTELLVELDAAQAYSASLEFDNHGNRYIGQQRVGAALALNSPLGLGDFLSLRTSTSGDNMRYGRLAYQVPVGRDGLKLGAAYYDTRYRLGKEFSNLQAHGAATSTSLFATYPLVRSQMANIAGTLSLEEKKLRDETEVPVSRADKQVRLVALGLAGSRPDTLGGGGMSGFDLSLTRGHLSLDAASLANDSAPGSAKTHGIFNKLTYNVNRLQRVSDDYSAWLALSGQQASKNLNSSEKFALGGANGVRAYPQGEASGDQGLLATLEVRRSFSPQLQAAVFYDAGSVDRNRNAFAAGENSRFIAGTGVGLNGAIGKLSFKTSLAWRTRGGFPQSDTVSRNPRWWLQANLPL